MSIWSDRFVYFARLILALFGIIGFGTAYAQEWWIALDLTNHNANGDPATARVYFGEHPMATDTYDVDYDFPLVSGGVNPTKVRMFFPKTNWGSYNGDYYRDTRSHTQTSKIWDTRITRNSPYSTNYTMSWIIPEETPPYLKLEMIIGGVTVNLRNSNTYNFTYTTPGTPQNFQLRTTVLNGIPYVTSPIGTQSFSNNVMRTLTLDQHFGIINGTISYSTSANPNIIQNISTIGGTRYWNYRPIHGYIGETSVSITATGPSGTCVHTISIIRDDTNTPPATSLEVESVPVMQNAYAEIDYSGTIYDIDLDPVTVSAVSGDFVSAFWNPDIEVLELVPNPGMKGTDVVYLVLNDEVNTVQMIPIEVHVLPSTPKSVQNPILEIDSEDPSLLKISWDSVTEDIGDAPLYGLRYEIQFFTQYPSDDSIIPWHTILQSEAYYSFPADLPVGFIRIVTRND